MTILDLSSLQKAISKLESGLLRFQLDTTDDQIRDGLIQRFEFTYELSHKMLKRYLEMTSANPDEVDQMDFQTLIRTANEQGLLLGDWPIWRVYRDQRARTSHTYDQEVAEKVVTFIPQFLKEAQFLFEKLTQRSK
ncbi:nucleotidyltransferase substrate binding protein [Polynucleobacter sp. MWH-Spelu-300-X4]|nr:nucleotidyltransferase substrate binding protein [Polynucleobacter sp. MWH-Spelu-300-X4]